MTTFKKGDEGLFNGAEFVFESIASDPKSSSAAVLWLKASPESAAFYLAPAARCERKAPPPPPPPKAQEPPARAPDPPNKPERKGVFGRGGK